MNLITLPAQAGPSPTPSPSITCQDVIHKAEQVIEAKNKVIGDYKQVVKDQDTLNWTLKQENREAHSALDITRVLAALGIFGGLIAGIFLGRSLK